MSFRSVVPVVVLVLVVYVLVVGVVVVVVVEVPVLARAGARPAAPDRPEPVGRPAIGNIHTVTDNRP